MNEYKIKKKSEVFDEIVVEKSNITIDFTLGSIKQEQILLQKYIKEFEANKKIQDGIIKNIEDNHKFVKKLDDFKLSTISMYAKAKDESKQYEGKIKEFSKQLKESEKELANIKKTLDIHENIVINTKDLK